MGSVVSALGDSGAKAAKKAFLNFIEEDYSIILILMIRRLAGCASFIGRKEQTIGTLRNSYQCQTVGQHWEQPQRDSFHFHNMDPQFKVME